MKKQTYTVLGVMSGTSLDGIDLALVRFHKDKDWTFELLDAATLAYPTQWEQKLRKAHQAGADELEALDVAYTQYLGMVIKEFLETHSDISPDAVCSHGHTVFHQPDQGITVQIGNRHELAAIIGRKVVCDFRVQDVELGGQGAPLVPVGDMHLFSDFTYCMNLGGFANISMSDGTKRKAYDICAVNTVLNRYAQKLGVPYDKGGALARNHEVNRKLLSALHEIAFYKLEPPKSLGIEWVEKEVFPLIDDLEVDPGVVLATYTRHVAETIAKELTMEGRVLVTGGGAYNTYLIDTLRELSNSEVVVPESGVVEFKEAVVFGFLGVLKMREEVNCLQSVTGASKDHSSGKVYNRLIN